MRTPILSTDLSSPFNQVASYLGRHWPDGKLKHNQGRELLANLLGYNSVHEVYKTAATNVLPESISLEEIKKSMFVRGLKRLNSSPKTLFSLLNRLPFSKLAFYRCTAQYKDEQAKVDANLDGKFLVEDEFHRALSYTSPAIFCQLFDQGLVPPYRQAVRKTSDGYEIFDQSRVEQLVRPFDDLPAEVLEEQGVEPSRILQDHIAPHIWYTLADHIDAMMEAKDFDLPRGFAVFVAFTSPKKDADRVFLIGNGEYGAVIPRVFKTISEVYEGIEVLLKGQPIRAQSARLPTLYRVRGGFNQSRSEHYVSRLGFTMHESYQDTHAFVHSGQKYVAVDPIKPYPVGWKEAVNFKTDDSRVIQNAQWPLENIIPASLAQESVQFQSVVLGSQDRNLYNLNKLSQAQWALLLNPANATAIIFESNELAVFLDEDITRDEYVLIGESVVRHFPELDGLFSLDVLGVIYNSSEANYDYYCSALDDELELCTERKIRFLIAVAAGLITGKTRYLADSDALVAACKVFSTWIFDVDWNLTYNWRDTAIDFLGDKISLLCDAISRHHEIDSFVKSLLAYEGSKPETDSRYVYNSERSEPKRQSTQASYVERYNNSRKLSTVLIDIAQSNGSPLS